MPMNGHLTIIDAIIAKVSALEKEWKETLRPVKETIDKREDMTATKKFAHLPECLKGEALEYISDLAISEKNYYTSHEEFEDSIWRQTKKNIGFIYRVTEFG
ncbi:ATP-dependent RNA helicase [Dirofilaria immitis]